MTQGHHSHPLSRVFMNLSEYYDRHHRIHHETTTLSWLADIGWRTVHGPDIAPGTPAAERSDYGDVILPHRLRNASPASTQAFPPMPWTTPSVS